MAVLKTLDLKGNKQSFASWISNLSPCDTPFSSMIGKEGIDEVQYSWQTDRLAPADNAAYEEGSEVLFRKPASTVEMTNFTSILRKVVNVSETAEEVATHGRNSELNYQMGKAGKEILRDLEWMNLSHVTSYPGTAGRASQHAGFEGLVAGVSLPDPDTGAIVHKTIQISGDRQTAIDKADIFDMTYNLYLAGSKADKIMYHPRHALAFSSLIGNNPEEARGIRMFDNMNTTFNTFVSKIRDPLSREYTLIPNRFMPEDKIYFFKESDWTQMILRSPSLTKLSKKGSSDSLLMEMEVGLRHTHPYASGVLALTNVNVQNTFVPQRVLFTSHVNDSLAVRCETAIDGVAEAGLVVTWFSSNSDVINFANQTTVTPASGRASNSMRAGEQTGIADVWTVVKGVRSAVTRITVGSPVIDLIVNNDKPNPQDKITLTSTVRKVDGTTPVGNGFEVKWYTNESSKIEFTSITSETNAGIATVEAKVLKNDPILLQALFGKIVSNKVVLNYVPTPFTLEDFSVKPNTIDINGFSDLTVKVLDEQGIPISGYDVNWVSSDSQVAQPSSHISKTNASGVAVQSIQGLLKGTCSVSVIAGTVNSNPITVYVGHGARLDFEMTPNPTTFGNPTNFRGSIVGDDGIGIQDVDFVIKSDVGNPPMRLNVRTDDDGDFDENHTFLDNSDHKITVEIPSLSITRSENLEIHDNLGIGELRAAEVTPQPIPVGGKSSAKVVLSEASGMPLKDAEVQWTVGPAHIVTPNATVTRTDQNGVSIIELTGVGKGTGEVVYRASRKVSDKASFLVGQGTDLVLTHSPEKPLSNQEVTITGLVKRADTNAPISGAEVVLKCSPDASYFPDVKLTTNAQGLVEYKTIFITEENFVLTANAPAFDVSASNTVEVQPIDGAGDIKYVHSVSGHTIRHTHSIPTDLPVTLYTTQHGGLPALNMKMECLDMNPDVAQSIVPNITTNTEGKILFHIRGLKAGIARFRVRAIGAIANFIDFEVTVADPQLGVTISPTTVGGGKQVEFSADLKDTHGNWVPGVNIRWEYPHNMLANGGQLGVQETDQFGRVYYDRVAALWGSHKIRAILENNTLVRSRDYTLTIHM